MRVPYRKDVEDVEIFADDWIWAREMQAEMVENLRANNAGRFYGSTSDDNYGNGLIAEKAFERVLDRRNIPYIVDRPTDRPDRFDFKIKHLLLDVKATPHYGWRTMIPDEQWCAERKVGKLKDIYIGAHQLEPSLCRIYGWFSWNAFERCPVTAEKDGRLTRALLLHESRSLTELWPWLM